MASLCSLPGHQYVKEATQRPDTSGAADRDYWLALARAARRPMELYGAMDGHVLRNLQ
jgi:hypothetical protein